MARSKSPDASTAPGVHAAPIRWQDRWQTLGSLGQGEAGAAFLVRESLNPSRTGALKVLNQATDPARRGRFHLESETLGRLISPRVPRLIDSNTAAFLSDEPLYLVMEHVPGPTLAAHVASHGVAPLAQAVRLVREVVVAVGHCHEAGVVHRDLTPENIILRDGQLDDPMLIDFGSCALAGNDGAAPDPYLGNGFLRLPEMRQPAGDKRDPRSDLSLCVGLLLFAATGQRPAQLRDEEGRAPTDRPAIRPRLDALAEGTTRELLRYVLDRGFWPALQHRWQTGVQLLGTLDQLASALTPRGLP